MTIQTAHHSATSPNIQPPATPLYQHGPELPSVVTAWTTASLQECKAMSTRDLHKIIEASFQYNKNMHQQPHITQNNTTPLPPAILAALSHPRTNHTHATTYRGNFSFTEDQNEFNTLIALHDPCTIVSNPNGGTPTIDYKSIQNTINEIVSNIQYTLFQELLFAQYVGKARSAINSSDFTSETIKQIKQLKLQFTHCGKSTTLTPDDLYIKYMSLTHTLPQNAREWHASLPSMFLEALTPELRTHLCDGDNAYIQPSFDTLTRKFDQEAALLQLRELSVKAALTLANRQKEMESTFKSMIQQQTSTHNTRTLSMYTRPQDSLAETTIRQHQNTIPHEDISFVVKYGQSYPNSTIRGRIIVSDWPVDFLGCLGCGNSDHFWQTCPNNKTGDIAAKKKFFDNLWCHKPHTYKPQALSTLHNSTGNTIQSSSNPNRVPPYPRLSLPPHLLAFQPHHQFTTQMTMANATEHTCMLPQHKSSSNLLPAPQ